MKINTNPKTLFPSLVLVLMGVYSFLIVQAPSKTGVIGQNIYSSFLIPNFGHAANLVAYYLIVCAGILVFSSLAIRKIIGLTFILLPVLIWVDELYVTEVFPAKSAINQWAQDAFVLYIGNAGLMLVEFIFIGIGAYLIAKSSKSSQSEAETQYDEDVESVPPIGNQIINDVPTVQEETEKTENVEESPEIKSEKPLKLKPLKDIPKVKEKKIELNLKPYRKSFSKPKLTDFEKQPPDSVSYGEKKDKIKNVFASLGVEVEMGTVIGGPSVEQYEIVPGKGVKLSQIKKLDEDLSLALKSKILITFNAQGSLCVEAPIAKRRTVFFRRLLESAGEVDAMLPVILGVNASYETYSFDLAELPHLLIAGTTGSGKSILVKTILASIMYNLSPNDVRFVLVDPKRVDFSIFNSSQFMACKVVTDMEDASTILTTLVNEMESRYDLLEKNNAANITLYNKSAKPGKQMPYIVTIVDEFADLIMGDKSDIKDNIIRIAQKARACGIHLILATQRPSAEVISGLIKANVPGKIALSVSSAINSKIIIDKTGAEKLLGKGDMIFISPELKDGVRLQGAFISDDEIMKFMK